MTRVTLWALESDYDARAIRTLAEKWMAFYNIQLELHHVGKKAVPRRRKSQKGLKQAVRNYLKDSAFVIFLIDTDGPISTAQRKREPNSLINQIQGVISDSAFSQRVFYAPIKPELEAWLLVDCLGIGCYFAQKRKQYRAEDCRTKISSNTKFNRVIQKFQRGDTQSLVEVEAGGKSAKEYLVTVSHAVLRFLNPQIPDKNISREQYTESFSPEIAKFIEITSETTRRNASLKAFGERLRSCHIKE